MPHVAFYTIGLLQQPLGSPLVKDYEAMTPALFEGMEGAPGFICLVDEGVMVRPTFAGSDGALPVSTLSVWTGLEAVFAFSYGGMHASALRQRKNWFVEHPHPAYVAWWIAGDHRPNWAEAVERYEHLDHHGPTPFAFDFRTAFDTAGSPVSVRKPARAQPAEDYPEREGST